MESLTHVKGKSDKKRESRKSSAAKKKTAHFQNDEALLFDMFNPFDLEADAPALKKRVGTSQISQPSAGDADRKSRNVTSSSEEDCSEYWQDVTAAKATNRKNSKLRLSLCSRRG